MGKHYFSPEYSPQSVELSLTLYPVNTPAQLWVSRHFPGCSGPGVRWGLECLPHCPCGTYTLPVNAVVTPQGWTDSLLPQLALWKAWWMAIAGGVKSSSWLSGVTNELRTLASQPGPAHPPATTSPPYLCPIRQPGNHLGCHPVGGTNQRFPLRHLFGNLGTETKVRQLDLKRKGMQQINHLKTLASTFGARWRELEIFILMKSERERQIPLISEKETDSAVENRVVAGRGMGKWGLGSAEAKGVCKVDKQRGPAAGHRGLSSASRQSTTEENMKSNIYIHTRTYTHTCNRTTLPNNRN